MTTVRLIEQFGPFPRLLIEDRSGEVHDIELDDEAARLVRHLGCESCSIYHDLFGVRS
jgi:hypothetical protein